MKQTATEWLFNQLWNTPKDKLTWYSLLERANKMFEEQIIDAYENGDNRSAELYYNETFKSE